MSHDQCKKDGTGKSIEDAILVDFFAAITAVYNKDEAKLFLSDLLSAFEMKRLARRLRIAILLSHGCTYLEIVNRLRAGENTIATVHRWLEHQGKGYAIVFDRLRDMGLLDIDKTDLSTDFENHSQCEYRKGKGSRFHPECFWPAELIQSINKASQIGDRKNRGRK